jgi:hypothetical protein
VRFFAESAVLRGQIVTLGTEDTEVVPCGDNELPLGIALNEVSDASLALYAIDDNQEHVAVEVAVHGMVPVLAGAELTMGQYVKSDANGRAVPVLLDASEENMVGKMYNVAAADGDETHLWINMLPLGVAAPA